MASHSFTLADGTVVGWHDSVMALNGLPGQRVPDEGVYIGRRLTLGGWRLDESPWANPYSVKVHGLQAALDLFYEDVVAKSDAELREWLAPLRGKQLYCWCHVRTRSGALSSKAHACHGDVLAHFLERLWPYADANATDASDVGACDK